MYRFSADDTNVRTGGRSIYTDGVRYLDYTCSFIEFEFEGTKAEAELISDLTPSEDMFRAYMAVFINGETIPSKRIKLDTARDTYTLYSSDTPSRVKIRLMKISEAAFAKAGVAGISVEGELLPPPKPEHERRIEFIGDSITCGYGIDGVFERDGFSTETENPIKGYAYKTALKCGAEFQYVSWSGIGVLSCWVEDTAEKPLDNWLLKDIYPYTDNGLENTLGKEGHENHTLWDFSSYKPQVIVFFDGTNDHSWTKRIPERCGDFAAAYSDMIDMIRKNNPDAYILCTYGIMDDPLKDVMIGVIGTKKAGGDDRIVYLPIPCQDEKNDGVAVDWHPSEKSHEKMSDLLSAEINDIFERMGI